MTLDVPEPIAAYLAAEERKDAQALANCFAEDGTVHDEGQLYRGRDAIRQWMEGADAKYHYVLKTLSARAQGNKVTVRARVTGDFPGSPLEMDHFFTISDNKIASLEIHS